MYMCSYMWSGLIMCSGNINSYMYFGGWETINLNFLMAPPKWTLIYMYIVYSAHSYEQVSVQYMHMFTY